MHARARVTGQPPFNGKDNEETRSKIRQLRYTWPDEKDVSEDAKHFVSTLLCGDPIQRATAADALRHRWITSAQVAHAEPCLGFGFGIQGVGFTVPGLPNSHPSHRRRRTGPCTCPA